MLRFRSRSVADLGDGPGPQLFWVKKEEMTVGKKASSASKSKPPSLPPPTPPLAQGLDLPLKTYFKRLVSFRHNCGLIECL